MAKVELQNRDDIGKAASAIVLQFEQAVSGERDRDEYESHFGKMTQDLASLLLLSRQQHPGIGTGFLASLIFQHLPDSLEKQGARELMNVRETVMGEAIDRLLAIREVDITTSTADNIRAQFRDLL